MRILFFGDIMGRSGRDGLAKHLPDLKTRLKPDVVIANAENSAAGFGVTDKIAKDLFALGIDCLTTGNHWADQKEILSYIGDEDRILRPKNFPAGTPGKGANLYVTREGLRILVVNVMGRVFMDPLDDPFAAVGGELDACPLAEGADAVVIDIHAEATSEKMGMGHFCDGRASLVVGTHTHVPTADSRIFPGGTAFQTDCGMTGPYDSVIGVEAETIVKRFVTGMPSRFETAKGDARLAAAVVSVDPKTGRATAIDRMLLREEDIARL